VTFTNKAAGRCRRAERLWRAGRCRRSSAPSTASRWFSTALWRPDRLARDFIRRRHQKSLVAQAMAASKFRERLPRAIRRDLGGPGRSNAGAPREHAPAARGARLPALRALCRKVSGVDFDDLLSFAVRLFTEAPEVGERVRGRCRALLVDEFQDTNHAQLRLVTELIGGDRKGGDLTAVGDEDQGIYRWRGADLSNVLEFERHFPGATIRKLERNYRSTANILEAANAVAQPLRRGKRSGPTPPGDQLALPGGRRAGRRSGSWGDRPPARAELSDQAVCGVRRAEPAPSGRFT
jgi:superfamily I DNA/RNA helicase